MIVAFDTETELIRPGLPAPPLVCVSWCEISPSDDYEVTGTPDSFRFQIGEPNLITWREATEWVLELLGKNGPNTIVGHNSFYDLAVLAAHTEKTHAGELIELVFRALDDDRIVDTMQRQMLADIGRGIFRLKDYDLGATAARHGFVVDKTDPWRLKYGTLMHVPLDEWPNDAKRYALDDATATAYAYVGQETRYDPALLVQQYERARAQWALHLTSCWGLRTSLRGVVDLERGTLEQIENLKKMLQSDEAPDGTKIEPLVQPEFLPNGKRNPKAGSKDTKAATRRMVAVHREAGTEPRRTKTGLEKQKQGVELGEFEYISLDGDACEQSGDPLLEAYTEYASLGKVLSNDLKWLKTGLVEPIHTHFGLTETLRVSSSKPNVQNPRKLPGVREAYVPRGFEHTEAVA